MRWALAVVGVHPVHADTSVLTGVSQTVVHVMIAVWTCESWGEESLVKKQLQTP